MYYVINISLLFTIDVCWNNLQNKCRADVCDPGSIMLDRRNLISSKKRQTRNKDRHALNPEETHYRISDKGLNKKL